jgi:hypothetical protein
MEAFGLRLLSQMVEKLLSGREEIDWERLFLYTSNGASKHRRKCDCHVKLYKDLLQVRRVRKEAMVVILLKKAFFQN